jgi:hypothetical protein
LFIISSKFKNLHLFILFFQVRWQRNASIHFSTVGELIIFEFWLHLSFSDVLNNYVLFIISSKFKLRTG